MRMDFSGRGMDPEPGNRERAGNALAFVGQFEPVGAGLLEADVRREDSLAQERFGGPHFPAPVGCREGERDLAFAHGLEALQDGQMDDEPPRAHGHHLGIFHEQFHGVGPPGHRDGRQLVSGGGMGVGFDAVIVTMVVVMAGFLGDDT